MKAIALFIGGTAAAIAIAIASKASASSASKTPPKTTPPKTTPPKTTPSTVVRPPEYLSSIPVTIVTRVRQLAKTDPDLIQGQAVWLRDNGWPRTADAVGQFQMGDIDETELRRVAQEEFESRQTAVPSTQKKKGTMFVDDYGTYVIEHGTLDEIYSYGSTATSIPSVAAAAAKLATAGDTRALGLTQHLADLR
jgi:hypothetical protein